MDGFVHLHVHSEYSLLDGAAKVDDLARKAAELNMPALALTDHGVMYGAIPFYKACKQYGIRPIIGCEVYYTNGSLEEKKGRDEEPLYHLILLAKNAVGYQNLMKLCTAGHLQGFYYKPRIDTRLLREHAEGLICLSACLGGEISRHLLHDRTDEAKKAAMKYRDIFGEDFYLEIQDHGLNEQKKVNGALISLSRETGIPLVATNDVHYVESCDHIVQDILICIGTGKTMDDETRFRIHTDQLYLKSPQEMERLFSHIPDALENTLRIAEKCHLEIPFHQSILPKFFPIPDGLTSTQYLARLCHEGLERRYAEDPKWKDEHFRAAVKNRLDYELGVIDKMGFSDYFLIVWDFVRFAHENGIATGPGRGSSAGSLVAYVLNITDVDPIRHNLLFERFLNPERVSMPDIDIDFSDLRRDEVIDYVVRKYGRERVAQIITFGTMAARASVRDVGRVLNLPYAVVDKAAKQIPSHPGMTIEDALSASPELRRMAQSDGEVARLLEMAKKVEGFPRHASTHAAGIVISSGPLTDYVPLQSGTEFADLTQYSMENLEALGLLKMDFLGLRYLSIIERTVEWIREQTGKSLDIRRIPLDDPKVYELLGRGETTGIFQLESSGMRRVLRDMKPSQFEDIISVLALYRPGPMEFIGDYIRAKHGEKEIKYPHPSLEPILKDTYGIIVYQEQIMQIASKMAGFTLGEADLLRRAVSKKKRDVLDEERAHFVEGCLRQGYTREEANRVYDLIVRFADYGFCRAHAAAYAVLAYQTAYLKARYPIQFMASMLTAVMGSHAKVAEYVEECRKMGIRVLPPDVNESGPLFTPVPGDRDASSGAIRFGLAAVKNVGTQAIESILKERLHGPFKDLTDFLRRVDLKICNRRVLESLIQSGAMDSLPGHRAQKLAMLDEALETIAKWKKEREDLQIHLFGFTEEIHWTLEMPDVRPWTLSQQLEMEKEYLGMYISGHPLDTYAERLREMEFDTANVLSEYPDDAPVALAGIVVQQKNVVTKKGQPMAFLQLEDRIGRTEVICFPETWKRFGSILDKGSFVVLFGRLRHQDEESPPSVIAEKIHRLEPGLFDDGMFMNFWRGWKRKRDHDFHPISSTKPALETPKKIGSERKRQRVYVKIGVQHENQEVLNRLKDLLKKHAGPLEVVLFYEKSQKLLALNEKYRIKPSPELFQHIEALLGNDSVKVK